jgi:hypothetical protein
MLEEGVGLPAWMGLVWKKQVLGGNWVTKIVVSKPVRGAYFIFERVAVVGPA